MTRFVPVAVVILLATISTVREVWSDNTGGAWLVGRVLEKATGTSIARYLETRLWSRFAMQNDGVWEALIKGQLDMGGHGFNATLRDWGRFALSA